MINVNVARSRPGVSRPAVEPRTGTMGAMRFAHIDATSRTHGFDK
jgi:hypothetical protein